jgi:NAD(P)-dependent dehydrogenase (short-subunit alcohol dehydrogenase family)
MAALVEEVEQAGARAHRLIRQIDSAEDITRDVGELLPLDVLVVAYGPMLRGAVEDTSLEDWRRMTELNFVMPAALVSLCLPSMRERDFGRILLFGGTRTDRLRGFKTIAAYGAAKTALGSLVKSTARQVAGYDIRINAICPGYVDTEYYEEADRTRARAASPGGKMIDPEEVARTAAFLLGRENESLTGAVIPLDGGMA